MQSSIYTYNYNYNNKTNVTNTITEHKSYNKQITNNKTRLRN